jgi:putative ABC transport system substrate-binding protein
MRRRNFLGVIGGAAAWPVTTRAQQVAPPVMGFMDSGSPAPNAQLVAALKQGLNESGYAEGQNLLIEYRWAEGNYSRLPELATDLVRRQVAVIVATGGELSGRAARAATSTIPIVFDAGGNPVEKGMVASLNRPGGNMTGINQMVEELVTKDLGLLHELVPKARVIGALVDPNNPTRSDAIVKSAQKTVGALGLHHGSPRCRQRRRHRQGLRHARQKAHSGTFRQPQCILLQPA